MKNAYDISDRIQNLTDRVISPSIFKKKRTTPKGSKEGTKGHLPLFLKGSKGKPRGPVKKEEGKSSKITQVAEVTSSVSPPPPLKGPSLV